MPKEWSLWAWVEKWCLFLFEEGVHASTKNGSPLGISIGIFLLLICVGRNGFEREKKKMNNVVKKFSSQSFYRKKEWEGRKTKVPFGSLFWATFEHFKFTYTFFHTLFHPHIYQKYSSNITQTSLPNTPKSFPSGGEMLNFFFLFHLAFFIIIF